MCVRKHHRARLRFSQRLPLVPDTSSCFLRVLRSTEYLRPPLWAQKKTPHRKQCTPAIRRIPERSRGSPLPAPQSNTTTRRGCHESQQQGVVAGATTCSSLTVHVLLAHRNYTTKSTNGRVKVTHDKQQLHGSLSLPARRGCRRRQPTWFSPVPLGRQLGWGLGLGHLQFTWPGRRDEPRRWRGKRRCRRGSSRRWVSERALRYCSV